MERKAQAQMGSLVSSTKYLRRISIHELGEIRRGNQSFLTFYEASITLIGKPDKDTTRKENYTLIVSMNTSAKILKIIAKQNPAICKRKIIHHRQVGFISSCKVGLVSPFNVIYYSNRIKDKMTGPSH